MFNRSSRSAVLLGALLFTCASLVTCDSAIAVDTGDALAKKMCISAVDREDSPFRAECQAFLHHSGAHKPNAAVVKPRKPASTVASDTDAEKDRRAAEALRESRISKLYFFLRQDQYDQINFHSRFEPFASIQGASLSFMADGKLKTQNLSTQSFLGISLHQFDDSNASALGAFIYADGNYTVPQKASEASALRFGAALETTPHLGQWSDSRSPIYLHLDAYPYIQTDFRGQALIGGGSFVAEIFNRSLTLGQGDPSLESSTIATYFRLLPELNVFDVSSAGVTKFHDNTTYALAGGSFGARTVFFQNDKAVPAFLCGRLYLNAAVQAYDETVSGKAIWDVNSELGYNLAPTPSSQACSGSLPSGANGTIAFDYFRGTDPATFYNQTQYKVALKLKF